MLTKFFQKEQQSHLENVTGRKNLNWADLTYLLKFLTSVILWNSGHDKEWHSKHGEIILEW